VEPEIGEAGRRDAGRANRTAPALPRIREAAMALVRLWGREERAAPAAEAKGRGNGGCGGAGS
jgi:hypothetical protein